MYVVRTMGCYVYSMFISSLNVCVQWSMKVMREPRHGVCVFAVCTLYPKTLVLNTWTNKCQLMLIRKKESSFFPLNDTPLKRQIAIHWNVRNFKPNNKWKSSRYWLIHKRCDRRAFGTSLLCKDTQYACQSTRAAYRFYLFILELKAESETVFLRCSIRCFRHR